MHSVLICNSSPAEVEMLRVAPRSKFSVHASTSWNPGSTDLNGIDAVLVDANYTEHQGLDFIMEVAATAHVPVLIITPPDDPHCAIEARRAGVFNYLVKTDKLYAVLEMALTEAIGKYNDTEEIKRTVVEQRQRIAKLEEELTQLKQSRPASPAAASPSAANSGAQPEEAGARRNRRAPAQRWGESADLSENQREARRTDV